MKAPSRWVHSWQKFRSIRNSDAVLCISESTKSDLLEYLPDISGDRIFVTPLAANEAFRSSTSCVLPEDYVVFVGSRVSYKNFSVLVNALAHLPDLRLLVVGGGQFSRVELNLLDRLLPGRYFHQGNVTIERLKQIYGHAVCLVYPTAYEGFGIPMLEAMAAACPVIALKSSSIPEVAGDAALLLEESDPKYLSEAIQHVSRSDVRQDLIIKGKDRAQLFSWDATFNKTRSVYETLLGRSLQ
jgi:mannosyltransferase